jgi:hypothetical protein
LARLASGKPLSLHRVVPGRPRGVGSSFAPVLPDVKSSVPAEQDMLKYTRTLHFGCGTFLTIGDYLTGVSTSFTPGRLCETRARVMPPLRRNMSAGGEEHERRHAGPCRARESAGAP